jgi:hypothetical protein
MIFPVQTRGALEDLGRTLLANCKSEDPNTEAACVARMEPKIQSCSANAPTTSKDKAQYKAVAEAYFDCVMPNLVCSGVEITSSEQMRAVCRKQT